MFLTSITRCELQGREKSVSAVASVDSLEEFLFSHSSPRGRASTAETLSWAHDSQSTVGKHYTNSRGHRGLVEKANDELQFVISP